MEQQQRGRGVTHPGRGVVGREHCRGMGVSLQCPLHPPHSYDIALLRLSGSATLNSYVQLAVLPSQGTVLANNYACYISGWGMTSSECHRHGHPRETHPQIPENCGEMGDVVGFWKWVEAPQGVVLGDGFRGANVSGSFVGFTKIPQKCGKMEEVHPFWKRIEILQGVEILKVV